jgi:hypothetical protein
MSVASSLVIAPYLVCTLPDERIVRCRITHSKKITGKLAAGGPAPQNLISSKPGQTLNFIDAFWLLWLLCHYGFLYSTKNQNLILLKLQIFKNSEFANSIVIKFIYLLLHP